MKKVFLDNLPVGGKYIGKNSINWEKAIGYKIPFIYDDIKGELPILAVIREKNCPYIVTGIW